MSPVDEHAAEATAGILPSAAADARLLESPGGEPVLAASKAIQALRPVRGVTYAALDLGTNNCRLLVARPSWDGFRVVDAFSPLDRLG